MTNILFHRGKVLLLWLFYNVVLFQLTRFLMLVYHYEHFKNLKGLQLWHIFIGGCRFDWIVIVIGNAFLILLFLLPFSLITHRRIFKLFSSISFIIIHLMLLLNLADIPYYTFIHKRSTFDLLYQLGGQTDIIKQIPAYVRDYWYFFILFFILIYINHRVYQKLCKYLNEQTFFISLNTKNVLIYSTTVIVTIGLSIISIRGGLQRIPLDIVDAGFYAEPEYTALVLNTPFTIIKSIEQKSLLTYDYFNENENIQHLHQIKHYPFDSMQKKNIVIIILESFSKEYTALGKRKSFTPFLDSLMQYSIVFENCWSNGTKSIEGIPAILSSMPSWMDNPFINSLYCNNKTHSFPALLKKESYYSAFFHGGINGTMNFDAYAKQAGFDNYYGKNEYGVDKDFDGFWGIWDEPFLQYAAKKISQFPQPFLASIFTLSSHHPFNVPEKYKNVLPKGSLPIHQCIAYTDLSLKKFFHTIHKEKWYNNSIFVITADHTGISEDVYYSSIAGRYQIPLIIFDPKNPSQQIEKNIIQQIDILPTILYLLKYPHSFFSFGNNFYDNEIPHWALFYESGNYYLVNDSTLNFFNQFSYQKSIDYRNQNIIELLLDSLSQKKSEELIKRIVQSYNNRMIKNDIFQLFN
ncbi:MAG: sulfatase [Bacteroidia bacterium]|nr:MAG: sulfatase [Bacteroidia bacterium]